MQTPAYDILRKDGLALVWVETADDIESARSRIERLADQSRNEYVVFDQHSRQIVAASAVNPTSEG
jgi:hypothetical protein